MSEQIKVLLAIPEPTAHVEIKKLLYQVSAAAEVVAETEELEGLVGLTLKSEPDLILLGIRLSEEEGIKLIKDLTDKIPAAKIIVFTDAEATSGQIQAVMLAGARALLDYPIKLEMFRETFARIFEIIKKERAQIEAEVSKEEIPSKKIAVFSTKGGVGRTLIATNLAVTLSKILAPRGHKVVLVDLDLQFGDIAIMLDIVPTKTISGLSKEINQLGKLDKELLESYLSKHDESGLYVLAAPLKPEEAELVSSQHIEAILNEMAKHYTFCIIDTPKHLTDTTLTALNLSSQILLLLTLDLPTIKNGKLCLEIMDSLDCGDKVSLVINRAGTQMGIEDKEVIDALDRPVLGFIPSDGRVTVPSVNKGIPFVTESPDAPITKSINQLAHVLIGDEKMEEKPVAKPATKKGGFLKGLLGIE